jgi:uncharacterized protein (DUF2384 family)
MSTPSLPMQIGVPLDQLSLLFFGSLAVAIWLVYLSCRQRFAERSVTGSSDYIYQLLPRQLATREEYSKGFLAYFGTMVATVVLLSLLGPKNLGSLGINLPDGVGYVMVPFAVALVLIGAMPTVPGLMAIEKFLREYAHKRAYIPDAARATAERLAAADFDFASYQGEVLHSPEMRGVDPADFTRSRRSLEHDWARLCCLVFVQKSCRMEDLTNALDASLLRDYERDLDLIESQKKTMESEVAAYRTARASDPYYTNDALRRAIRDNLCKLYVLLGCAVRLKMQPHDDIDLALAQFGFRLDHARHGRDDTGDLKLVGLATVAASITAIGLAAMGLGQLHLWAVSEVFPQTMFQPFIDAVSALIPHATAIMVADIIRRRAVDSGSWFGSSGGRRRANAANYIRVAMICGIAGYVALVLWGLTQQAPTVDGFKIEVPNALLAMATGGFYVYHLDNAEIGRRPSRLWELGAQTAVTGLCGLVAACATWEFIFGSASAALDRIVLTAVVNAAVGLVLAWYIPQAAAATRYDPLADARDERARALDTAARTRMGDAAAETWLDMPHPALGNKPPRAVAAANVDGFERAIALLQGPRALAA